MPCGLNTESRLSAVKRGRSKINLLLRSWRSTGRSNFISLPRSWRHNHLLLGLSRKLLPCGAMSCSSRAKELLFEYVCRDEWGHHIGGLSSSGWRRLGLKLVGIGRCTASPLWSGHLGREGTGRILEFWKDWVEDDWNPWKICMNFNETEFLIIFNASMCYVVLVGGI
jgi:hypothetical protein